MSVIMTIKPRLHFIFPNDSIGIVQNRFLFDEPLKGSKSLKIFKISLTFRFDKL
jgi:hypothetical protein